MITKTRLFKALLLTAICVNTAVAQEKLEKLMKETTPVERAEMQTENMAKTLSLTAEQKEKTAEVNLKYAHRMQTAYDSGAGRLDRLKKMKVVGEEKDNELKKIFTPEQYAKYQKNREEMKNDMRSKAKERNH